MNRTVLGMNNLEIINTSDCVLLNMSKFNGQLDISKNTNILVTDITANSSLTLNISNNVDVSISVLAKSNLSNVSFVYNVGENSTLNAYFADFSFGKEKVKVEINLNKDRANAYWHLASLSSNTDEKEFDVSVYHNAPNTSAVSDNYGVCKDEAKLVFSGESSILNGAIKSKTRQNAKIMEFDPLSKAVAKPILKIDENDIEASHGAVVGKINDDHLFYLTSRGLSESEAKKLITYGYLKPITNGFDEDEIKEEISSLIEGRM